MTRRSARRGPKGAPYLPTVTGRAEAGVGRQRAANPREEHSAEMRWTLRVARAMRNGRKRPKTVRLAPQSDCSVRRHGRTRGNSYRLHAILDLPPLRLTTGRRVRLSSIRTLGSATLLALCAACDTPGDVIDIGKVPADQRGPDAVVRLVLSGEPLPANFSSRGQVEGNSCQENAMLDPPASITDALEQLRFKALLAGGNAVTDVSCVEHGLGPKCWSAIRCVGSAISTE